MTKEQLRLLVETGREIEFDYMGKQYSITYYSDNREDYISFCEFYEETLDVKDVDALWNSTYKNMNVGEMLSSLTEKDMDVI